MFMLLKMVILLKRENLMKATQSNEYIVFLIFKDKLQFLLLCSFFELTKALYRERVHVFSKTYITFSNIKNCMLKTLHKTTVNTGFLYTIFSRIRTEYG